MRKNVKQQLALRVLSTAALVAMVSSIATAAFAAEYNVAEGSVEIVAKDGSQSITQWADKDKGTFVKDENGDNIDHRPDSKIVLVTKDETTGETKPTSNTVTITAENKGDTANVTLKDVDIETKLGSDSAPIEIKGNGDTNLELNGNNTVLSGYYKHAGIEKADVNGTGTLTIKDDVNDNNKPKTGTEEDTTGTLLAGGCGDGAGIGAGKYHGDYYTEDQKDDVSTSNITITGGKITASGGVSGAGIGGGYGGDASNIRIEGNADVTAFGSHGAAIGSGSESSGNSDITITDHATVDATSEEGCAIGNSMYGKVTVTISGHASVKAQALDGSPAAIGSSLSSATVNIEDHADVTAVSDGVAIGTGFGTDGFGSHGMGATSTVINITGGTVNAVTRSGYPKPAIGTACGNLDVTINSSTGKTTVNAYTTSSNHLPLIGTAGRNNSPTSKYGIDPSEDAEYNEDGSSHLGEDNAAIINFYCNTPLGTDTFNEPTTRDPDAFDAIPDWPHNFYHPKHTLSDKDKGDLYKVVHNRKYMEEHPEIVDISKLKDDDLHAWQPIPGGEYKKPTLEEDGYVDCICGIDKCGQTKRVPLPKLTPEPSEPDTPSTPETPDTPNKPDTPKQPDGTTPAPVTPDAPAQDGTAPADTPAADTTAAVQNVAQNAEPEAAAAAPTAAPAAAATLPQTGANWLAVVGTALSGLFLLAAGFVLDRKNRRMN